VRHRRLALALVSASVVGLGLAYAVASSGEAPASGPPGRPIHSGALAEALGVFRTGKPARVPAAIRAEAEHGFTASDEVPEALRPGHLRLDEARLLLVNLGSAKLAIYAWPTAKGSVCYLVAGLVGGCDKRLTDEYPVSVVGGDPDAPGRGRPGIVAGLVTDDVVRVDVRAAGELHRAEVANNAYFVELPVHAGAAEAILTRAHDGTTRTLDLRRPKTKRH
jgi:hypothetical protein